MVSLDEQVVGATFRVSTLDLHTFLQIHRCDPVSTLPAGLVLHNILNRLESI